MTWQTMAYRKWKNRRGDHRCLKCMSWVSRWAMIVLNDTYFMLGRTSDFLLDMLHLDRALYVHVVRHIYWLKVLLARNKNLPLWKTVIQSFFLQTVLSLAAQSCPALYDPMDCSLAGSSVHGDSPGKNTGMGCHVLLQEIFPNQGSNSGILPALWANSLPSEPPGKPKNTGVGSLSVFQGILLTQESNQGLLHCRWILYQLSYQGSS